MQITRARGGLGANVLGCAFYAAGPARWLGACCSVRPDTSRHLDDTVIRSSWRRCSGSRHEVAGEPADCQPADLFRGSGIVKQADGIQQRLTGEDNPPLGNRPHLSGEPQARQRAEGVLLIPPGLAQVAEIIRGEREVLEELQSARCAATSGSPACRPPWRSPCFLAVVYLFQRRDLTA
jgi:hypothetical protein